MNQNHEFQNESEKNNKAMIFYILAALLLLYMGMSAITSYQSFAAYCDNYGLTIGAVVLRIPDDSGCDRSLSGLCRPSLWHRIIAG